MFLSLLWFVALALFVAGYIQWFRALGRLSAEGQARRTEVVLVSQLFAGRAAFTSAGWRLRMQALCCVALALLCGALALYSGGLPFAPAAGR